MQHVNGSFMLKDGLLMVPWSLGRFDQNTLAGELLTLHWQALRSTRTPLERGIYWVKLGRILDSTGEVPMATTVTLSFEETKILSTPKQFALSRLLG